VLVQSKTALVPNFFQKAPGLPKGWSKFEAEDRRLFADPFLMSYYPSARAQVILWNFLAPPNVFPEVLEQRTKGYQNALKFHRMLIQAGGRVLVGTDGGQLASPGLGVHHEMEIFANDLGLPAMQVIQAATKWPAETLKVEKQLGTIETGKLADILIADADPLQDIANLNKISNVIADGKLVDRTYHAWYRSPFGGEGPVTIPVVDDVGWALNLRRQNPGFGGPPAPPAPQTEGGGQRGQRGQRGGAPAQAAAPAPLPPGPGGARQPQPTIETIDSGRRDYPDPDFSKVVVKEGGPTLNFKITGFNYFQRSQVYFNDIPVPTRVISRAQLEATIDETLLRTPGRYPIVVKNLGLADPANPRIGDGTSNTGWLIVNFR
jgi:Amidohydrolase family